MRRNEPPIPAPLVERLRVFQHDVAKVRENVALGRVPPTQYADLERVLTTRLALLEAEVHARLLGEARARNARFLLN